MTNKKLVMSGVHFLLGAMFVIEFRMAKLQFHKLLAGGGAGWHFAAAIIDWTGEEQSPP